MERERNRCSFLPAGALGRDGELIEPRAHEHDEGASETRGGRRPPIERDRPIHDRHAAADREIGRDAVRAASVVGPSSWTEIVGGRELYPRGAARRVIRTS